MAKILIVDDDKSLVASLRRILYKENHTVIELNNGVDVPEVLQAEKPDLMICDMLMPVKDGVQTVANARESHPGLPIIAMTGAVENMSNDYLDYCKDLGVSDVFRKPIDKTMLLELLSKYI